MGWGDEIIAAGQARRLHAETGFPVLIVDRNHRGREHEAWRGLPYIAPKNTMVTRRVAVLLNGPGVRPYISRKSMTQWGWREWDCPVAEMRFDESELAFAAAYSPEVIIEPNLKAKASPNKDWGFSNWYRLANMLIARGFRVSQLGPAGTRMLPGVEHIVTPTMRHAAAVLARARFAVLPEGGLHHTAAAVGTRAAVIFGGYISPRQTGYKSHVNFFTGGEPCGMRVPCPHCRDAMEAILPESIANVVEEQTEAAA